MVIAADYPFLDVLWTMLVFFGWVIWFWLLIKVFADLFRRHDLSGWAKTFWIIGLILLPFLGVFIYLISHSRDMAERDAEQAQAASGPDGGLRALGLGTPAARPGRSTRPTASSSGAPSPRPSSTPSRPRRWPRAEAAMRRLALIVVAVHRASARGLRGVR